MPDSSSNRSKHNVVAVDVHAEFSHHIEAERDLLVAQGMSPDEASRLALERFGNVEAYQYECERIATRPHRRAVRLLAACSVVLVCGIAGQWLAGRHAQARYDRSLSELREQIALLQSATSADRNPLQLPTAQSLRFVTLSGQVKRPNLWVFNRDVNVTLRQLISKAGGLRPDAIGEVKLARSSSSSSAHVETISAADWNNPNGPDPIIDSTMVIEVR